MKNDIAELMMNQKHILEAIKYLNERIEYKAKNENTNEVNDILESQAMIDQIIVKNSDDILIIRKTKEENTLAIQQLESKIDKIEEEIVTTKRTIREKMDKESERLKPDNSLNSLTCKLCDETFDKYVDLENHIKSCHEKHSVFECEQCKKGFVVKWRLKKHMRLHADINIKTCHYFNNSKNCPYEELGCMFRHSVGKKCNFGLKCTRRLCPHRHDETNTGKDTDMMIDDGENVDEDHDDNSDTESDSFKASTPNKNCYKCDECENTTQCTDCYVRQEYYGPNKQHRVHFLDDE